MILTHDDHDWHLLFSGVLPLFKVTGLICSSSGPGSIFLHLTPSTTVRQLIVSFEAQHRYESTDRL